MQRVIDYIHEVTMDCVKLAKEDKEKFLVYLNFANLLKDIEEKVKAADKLQRLEAKMKCDDCFYKKKHEARVYCVDCEHFEDNWCFYFEEPMNENEYCSMGVEREQDEIY